MRIPRTKAWRAYPALDVFTDAECRVYMREARGRIWVRGTLMAATGFLAGAAMAAILAVILNAVMDAFRLGNTRDTTYQWLIVVAIGAFAALFLPVLGAFIGSDAWSRSALRRRLCLTECGGCGYNLVGITVTENPSAADDAAVRCPECGLVTPLKGSGKTPADFEPRTAPPTSRPEWTRS